MFFVNFDDKKAIRIKYYIFLRCFFSFYQWDFFINHLFVQVFGRAYGLVGTYSAKLPGLKFLITAYVLIAFFGRKQDKATFNEARGFSGYQYNDKLDTLMKHDLSDIHGLTKLLSEMDVMPGMNIIKFTTAIYDRFGTQMMPGFEDLSRFLSLIMTSSIGVQTIARSVISKFQRDMYVRMFMDQIWDGSSINGFINLVILTTNLDGGFHPKMKSVLLSIKSGEIMIFSKCP